MSSTTSSHYANDVMIITSPKPRAAGKLLAKNRKRYKKGKDQFVTIKSSAPSPVSTKKASSPQSINRNLLLTINSIENSFHPAFVRRETPGFQNKNIIDALFLPGNHVKIALPFEGLATFSFQMYFVTTTFPMQTLALYKKLCFSNSNNLEKVCVLVVSVLLINSVYSQNVLIDSPEPHWISNPSQTIKSQHIKTDKVFFYKNKRNKDSSLVATQYFDSLGNLVERDIYSLKGEVVKISNFIYMDTFLMREETTSKTTYSINRSNLSKQVTTYDYDNLGNVIAEKDYSFFGESLKTVSVSTWNREYDATRHLTKEYYTPPEGKSFLYHIYDYSGGMLTEIKSYDYNEHWIYSDLFEFDKTSNIKTAYLYNNSKKLNEELFYDAQKNLVMEKIYGGIPHLYSDHVTRTYSYDSNGILEKQTEQNIRGEISYYKHFYTKFASCDPIFTKVQILPSLKISNEAFEDTLLAALRSRNFPLNDKEIICKFVLTNKAEINDLAAESGNIANEAILKEIIFQLAGLWKPATQNGQPVCAFTRLHLNFGHGKVTIEITQ